MMPLVPRVELGLTRQKMKRVAIRRSDVLRAQYMAEMSAFDPDMLVFYGRNWI